MDRDSNYSYFLDLGPEHDLKPNILNYFWLNKFRPCISLSGTVIRCANKQIKNDDRYAALQSQRQYLYTLQTCKQIVIDVLPFYYMFI